MNKNLKIALFGILILIGIVIMFYLIMAFFTPLNHKIIDDNKFLHFLCEQQFTCSINDKASIMCKSIDKNLRLFPKTPPLFTSYNRKKIKSNCFFTDRKMKKVLEKIVGAGQVFDDPDLLEGYSRDHSFFKPRRPTWVVKPRTAEEIQGIVRLADRNRVPITSLSDPA